LYSLPYETYQSSECRGGSLCPHEQTDTPCFLKGFCRGRCLHRPEKTRIIGGGDCTVEGSTIDVSLRLRSGQALSTPLNMTLQYFGYVIYSLILISTSGSSFVSFLYFDINRWSQLTLNIFAKDNNSMSVTNLLPHSILCIAFLSRSMPSSCILSASALWLILGVMDFLISYIFIPHILFLFSDLFLNIINFLTIFDIQCLTKQL